MRPPAGARPAARDTSNSVGPPLQLRGDGERGTRAHPAHKHTRAGARAARQAAPAHPRRRAPRRVGGAASARRRPRARERPGLPRGLAAARRAPTGAERRRPACPALGRRGPWARAHRGDGLRAAGDRGRGARAGGDRRPGRGWLVPPDDEDALADALVTAASDAEERRRRGARAYRHSHTHYGWPLIAARIAALYAELLAAPPRAACA